MNTCSPCLKKKNESNLECLSLNFLDALLSLSVSCNHCTVFNSVHSNEPVMPEIILLRMLHKGR